MHVKSLIFENAIAKKLNTSLINENLNYFYKYKTCEGFSKLSKNIVYSFCSYSSIFQALSNDGLVKMIGENKHNKSTFLLKKKNLMKGKILDAFLYLHKKCRKTNI